VSLVRYRAALARPGVARVIVTSLIARAPNGMSSLAMILLVSRQHGYGRAGVAVGVTVGITCVSNPLLARLAITLGARPVLIASSVAYATCMGALAAVPESSYAAQLACCAGAGLSMPPVVAVVRGLWPRLFTPDEAQALYGLEATAQEAIFILGPALVAVIAAVAGAHAAVAATGAIGLAGTIALSSSPLLHQHGARRVRERHQLLRGSRLPMYVVIAFTLTVAFNMCDIAIVAFISGRRANAAAGVVLALWSGGSMLGGLLFGARGGAADEASVARACLAVAAGVGAAALAPGRIGLAVIMFVGGMFIAPALGRLYSRVAGIVPEDSATEAFAWIGVGLLAGSAVGAAAGGITVDALGARMTFLLAAAVPAAVAAVLLAVGSRDASLSDAEPLPS
jgi:predicted MFS family arabinose efflux permease